jgi:hypothetical protein
VFASALFHGMLVEELNDLDLSYTPPLGSPWDAVQLGSQAWAAVLRAGRLARGSTSSNSTNAAPPTPEN